VAELSGKAARAAPSATSWYPTIAGGSEAGMAARALTLLVRCGDPGQRVQALGDSDRVVAGMRGAKPGTRQRLRAHLVAQ